MILFLITDFEEQKCPVLTRNSRIIQFCSDTDNSPEIFNFNERLKAWLVFPNIVQ